MVFLRIYSAETEVEIITLEGTLFLPQKNDLAFVIDKKFVVLVEHQSSLSENIPLRLFLYLAREYERIVKDDSLYRRKRVMIPTPDLYVLYNGLDECPQETILKLSDSFKVPLVHGVMELEVKLLNVNYKKNDQMKWMQRSKTLHDYSLFIHRIRDCLSVGYARDESIEIAISNCISEGVLEDYLVKRGSEVRNMLLKEFDFEEALQIRGEEEREEGRREGHQAGRKEERRKLALSLLDVLDETTISEKTGLTIAELEVLKKKKSN